jgi:hypothetical protein
MNNKLFLSLAVILFVCLVGWTEYAKARRSSPATHHWEYKVLVLTQPTFPEQLNDMNHLGAEGWELVAVDNSHQYFKREIIYLPK